MDNAVQTVRVGIADLKIVRAPQTIRTTGLGSCVGVIIYDLSMHVAGMAHIMLPDSSIVKETDSFNKAKFADTAIKELVKELKKEGCASIHLKAKMAGGAEMFSFTVNENMRIGKRNIEAVIKALDMEGIKIISKDVGGKSGRTIEFDTEKGILQIKTVNKGITFI